eukprot:467658-Amorphochlora_amoeboformis.AAC.1
MQRGRRARRKRRKERRQKHNGMVSSERRWFREGGLEEGESQGTGQDGTGVRERIFVFSLTQIENLRHLSMSIYIACIYAYNNMKRRT